MSAQKNGNVEQESSYLDKLMWIVIFALLAGGVVANQMYASIPLPTRLIAWIFLILSCLGLALLTKQGRTTREFASNSWIELQKVVWPNKQETVQTTLIVMVMVTIVSLMIWGVDSVLLVVIGILTGQRG